MLLHLLNFEHHRDDYIVPESVTEQGIHKAINCDIGYLSRVLKELEKEKLLYRKKMKVAGKKCKIFAFFLTKKGKKVSMRIRKSIE